MRNIFLWTFRILFLLCIALKALLRTNVLNDPALFSVSFCQLLAVKSLRTFVRSSAFGVVNPFFILVLTSPEDTHKMTLVAVVLGKCQDKLGKLCATICSKIGPKQVLRHLKS